MNALADLAQTLCTEADAHEAAARHVKIVSGRPVPVYNPIEWGRMEAKREIAQRIDEILKGNENA